MKYEDIWETKIIYAGPSLAASLRDFLNENQIQEFKLLAFKELSYARIIYKLPNKAHGDKGVTV